MNTREMVRLAFTSTDLSENKYHSMDMTPKPTIASVAVPLSDDGDRYYFVDDVADAAHKWIRGDTRLDLFIYGCQDEIITPTREQLATVSELIDFSVDKEILSKIYADGYETERDLEQVIQNLERESHLSKREWATSSILAAPILHKKTRENLGGGGAIAGGLLGLLSGLPPNPVTTAFIGSVTGYALGSMSPLIAASAYLAHKKIGRINATSDELGQARKHLKYLKMITKISDYAKRIPPSRVLSGKCFDSSFPMGGMTPYLYAPGVARQGKRDLMERALLDVLACDIDGFLAGRMSDRARAYYWKVFENIKWPDYLKEIADSIRGVRPREHIEMRSPIDSSVREIDNDWTMLLGNPAHTNCFTLKKDLDLSGLILSSYVTVDMSNDVGYVYCEAYNYDGVKVWNFKKKVREDPGHILRIHNNNLLLLDTWGIDPSFELDILSGKELSSCELSSMYVWKGIGIGAKDGCIKLTKYPSGEEIFSKQIDEQYCDSNRILGIVEGTAVIDFTKKFVIMDLNNPKEAKVVEKSLRSGEIFKLVNMDNEGIVGIHHSENAHIFMDDDYISGRKEGEFSRLIYLNHDGNPQFDPIAFGQHVFPEGMPLLDGKVYLTVGQERSAMAGGRHSRLYCYDLHTNTDVWCRSIGTKAIPTNDLTYIHNGTAAVKSNNGSDVWKATLNPEDFGYNQDSMLSNFMINQTSVTAEYVIQLIDNCRDRSTYFLRIMDRFSGRNKEVIKIQNPDNQSELYQTRMICVDFAR